MEHENFDEPSPKRKGTLLMADDLQVGQFYAVYGAKYGDGPLPINGLAWQCKAINLPFVVGKLVIDPCMPSVTLDVRYHELMQVSEEYVKAQSPPSKNIADAFSLQNIFK